MLATKTFTGHFGGMGLCIFNIGKKIIRKESLLKAHFIFYYAFNFILFMHVSVMFLHLEEWNN